MSNFSAESPFAIPKQQQETQEVPVQQAPEQPTFQPAWDEHTTRYYTDNYRHNPKLYSEEQLNQIRQHASHYSVPFYEGEFSVVEAIKQAGAGFFEGFTTLSIADHPDNEYEAISRNLGHLAGFAPSILVKPLRAVKALRAAEKLGAMRSIPMLGADFIQRKAKKIISPTLAAARESRHGAIRAASNFMSGQSTVGKTSKHILEGAFHLGAASAISGWQQGIDGMMESFVGGAVAGGTFRSIGNFIKIGDPKGQTMVRGIAGSLFMGLPSTMRGDTTPEQIYEYVMGAYFGGSETSYARANAGKFMQKIEKRAQKDIKFRISKDPEEMPGWEKLDKAEQKIVRKFHKQRYDTQEQQDAIAYELANKFGLFKGFTEKGDLIVDVPGWKLTSEMVDGEARWKIDPNFYKKIGKYGISGREKGDAVWAQILSRHGMPLIHQTFKAHSDFQKKKGIDPAGFENQLTQAELDLGLQPVREANIILQRGDVDAFTGIRLNLLKRGFHQIKDADGMFVAGEFAHGKNKQEIAGDNAFTVQMLINRSIKEKSQVPIHVLNTIDGKWNKYNYKSRVFEEAKAPKEIPKRSVFLGSELLNTNNPRYAELYKSMTNLVSEGYGKSGPMPKVAGKTPQEIKYIREATKDVEKKIQDLSKEVKSKSKSMFTEQNAQIKREKEIELQNSKTELAEAKDELRKLVKDIDLDRYDEQGALKTEKEGANEIEDVDNSISVTSTEIGNKSVRFVNTHLKEIWGNDKKFFTPELQLLEQERLSKVFSDKIEQFLDKGSNKNRSEEWANSVQEELGIGLPESGRREMRNWIAQRNQNVPVQQYGVSVNKAGVDTNIKPLDPIHPKSGSGKNKAIWEPLIELDNIYHRYNNISPENKLKAENRAVAILDHVTFNTKDGFSFDKSLSRYKSDLISYAEGNTPQEKERFGTIEYNKFISKIMNSLSKKDMYVYGGKGDKDRLVFLKYHPLIGKLDNNVVRRMQDFYGKDFKESEKLAKKVYKMSYGDHSKAYLSNILYNIESNGFEIGKNQKSIIDYLNTMNSADYNFIGNPKGFNKRSQIWMTNGYAGSSEFARDVSKVPGLTKDGHGKYILVEDLPKGLKDNFSDIETMNINLPEGVDGAIIGTTKMLKNHAADSGNPVESINNKSFIVSPHKKHGALLGKYMMHDAGEGLSKAMENYVDPKTGEKGLHYIVMESAAKQTGTRKLGQYEYNNGQLTVSKDAEVYTLPMEHIKHNFSVISDKHMASWQKLPKQPLSALSLSNWNPTNKDVVDDMVKTLMEDKFKGDVEYNKMLEDYLTTRPGEEKESKLQDVIKNIDKMSIPRLLDVMTTSGNEKLATVAYGRMMKLSKNWLERATAEGELTPAERNEALAELNEVNGVAEEMLKLNPNLEVLLHKFVNKYRMAVMRNYIVQTITRPTVNNSLVARMRPYDKALREELKGRLNGTNDEIFFLDEGFKMTRIEHNIKGREDLKTLGELWNAYEKGQLDFSKKATEEDANIDKIFNALNLRVPMDSMSGAHKLKFMGFTGRLGHGVLLHGRTMRALGGADLDADEAFVFFGGKGGFKESWKDAYHSNKKEYYTATSKITGKKIPFKEYEKLSTEQKKKYTVEVRENKSDLLSPHAKKLLGLEKVKGDMSLRELLTLQNIPFYSDTAPTTNKSVNDLSGTGMMYSPVERIRISEATTAARNMLAESAVTPKQLMTATSSALLSPNNPLGVGKDSYIIDSDFVKFKLDVELRQDPESMDFQRQLMRAQVAFASDPLDEAGLKSSNAWAKMLFNAHFKVNNITPVKGKRPLSKKGMQNVLDSIEGYKLLGTINNEGGESMYSKMHAMNKAYFGKNWKTNRHFSMNEINELSKYIKDFHPNQINNSTAHVSRILHGLDWSDSVIKRVDGNNLNQIYNKLLTNIQSGKYEWLKDLMGRSTFQTKSGTTIDKVLTNSLYDANQVDIFSKSWQAYYKLMKGIKGFEVTEKEAQSMTKLERIDKIDQLRKRADDFLVNDLSDMVTLVRVSDIAGGMSAKELAQIPALHKFVENIKLNSWLKAKERENITLEELVDIVEDAEVRKKQHEIVNAMNELIDEGKSPRGNLSDKYWKVPKKSAQDKKSATLDQVEIDRRIRVFKKKLKGNKKLEDMLDALMIGTYRRGDLAKINEFTDKMEGKWDSHILKMFRSMKNEAAKTSLTQLGMSSQAVNKKSKSDFLSLYGSALKKAYKTPTPESINKELDLIEKFENPAIEPEYPDYVAKELAPEYGLEGIKGGQLSERNRKLVSSIATNLKSYNNRVGQSLPEIVRGLIGKNLNAMDRQDFVAVDNFFKEIKRGTIFQAFSKNDLQSLQKRHWWLFPKTVNRELMKYDIQLMKKNGYFLDRFGKLKEGRIVEPTHYLDMLQTWISRMNDQATQKAEQWIKMLQERLLFVNTIPEGEILRQGAVHKRQLGYAEGLAKRANVDKTKSHTQADEYYKRLKEWESEHKSLLDNEFTISIVNEQGKSERIKKTGRQIRDMINKEYTGFFKEMYSFIEGKDPSKIEKFNLTKKGDTFRTYNHKEFIKELQKSFESGKDITDEYGIDGLRYIARSMMVDMVQKKHKNADLIKIMKENKIDKTGEMKSDHYWPHMFFNNKDASKAMKAAYTKLKNTPDENFKPGEKEKALADLIFKHKRLTGDWNFSDVEEWDLYENVMHDLGGKRKVSEEKIKWFGENQRAGSMHSRTNHIAGWSVDATVPDAYIRSLSNTYHRQLSNIFSRNLIEEMSNPFFSFAKKFGPEQTAAWQKYMKLYVQDALGNAVNVPEALYNDPIMKLKGTPYAAWADNRVKNSINKAMEKLGITDMSTPEIMRGIDVNTLRHWSNLEAQYEMASLLAHPKSMVTNIFGGTIHTIQSAGWQNWRNARDIKYLRGIIPEFKSMEDVDRFVVESGVLPEYMIAEFGVKKELQQANNLAFVKEVAGKLSGKSSVSKETLNKIQQKYGVKDRVVQFAAKFMSVPERAIRRDAFMAHYVHAWNKLGGALDNPKHPAILEMAKKGVKATQFLYSAPFRPAFSRTALGKVLTRFQMWSWNSVRFRNDVARQARIYGLIPGTESYEKYKRTVQTDLFMFAMANVFMYSIFETALPAPYNWYQDTADWLFGDENERNKAFYGAWPTQVAPLQMITPPVLRMVPATARALVDDDWSKVSGYYGWTMFPFGRMARDIAGPGNLIENPMRVLEKMAGIPVMQTTRWMNKRDERALPPSPSIFKKTKSKKEK